jgi:transcriptional regulator with XRE-family HTH domain
MTQNERSEHPTEPYESAAAVVRQRVKQLREGRKMSAARLAELCAENGMPNLNRDVIANLESGRRPNVTIDEVMVLALALDVAPVNLFIPVDERWLTVGKWIVGAGVAREWSRGTYPLGGQDALTYRTEAPEQEWRPPADVESLLAELAVLTERLKEAQARSKAKAKRPTASRADIEAMGGRVVYVPKEESE